MLCEREVNIHHECSALNPTWKEREKKTKFVNNNTPELSSHSCHCKQEELSKSYKNIYHKFIADQTQTI